MIDDVDMEELNRTPRIRHYFRYRLERDDFHDLRVRDRVEGHYTAKALYDQLTPEGRVDRTSGLSGDIAALFVPMEARGVKDVELHLTHVPPAELLLPGGRKNRVVINHAAEARIRETFPRP